MPSPHSHAQQFAPTGVWPMLGGISGVALQLQQPQLWLASTYIVMVSIAVVAALVMLRRASSFNSSRFILAVIGMVLMFAVTGWRAAYFQSQAMPSAWEGRDLRVTGVIVGMPQTMEQGIRVRFRTEHAHAANALHPAIALPSLLALTWYGEPSERPLQAGQRWTWTVRLKAPHGERNPHGMDWELWWWSQGIQALGYIRQGSAVADPQWIGDTWAVPMEQLRGHLHRSMQLRVDADGRSAASLGVVQALVTGAQSSIARQDWQLFRDTGVAHLVSISGLHITMFAWAAIAVVNRGWRLFPSLCLRCPAPLAAAWSGLVLATAYALFSGWGVPAQRTIGMLMLVVILRACGKSWPWPYVWLMVLTAVLMVDPWSLLQAGFWLSFVAVGVLFAAQPRDRSPRTNQALGWAHQLLREQLIVGLALAPLTLLLFGQVSVIGMVANLLAIPWVTLVITPLSMFGVLCPGLWEVAAWAVTWGVALLQWLVKVPHAVWYFSHPPAWVGMLGVLGCIWLVMPMGWAWRCLVIPCVLPMVLWSSRTPAWGEFDVLALDVGQGSAVLLRTQTKSLLFDAGPKWSAHTDAGERTVVPTLRALGVDLDVMLVSHADKDHAGGARSVQQAFPHLQWRGSGGQPCVQGQQWEWDGVRWEVLHPPSEETLLGVKNNALSCVLRVESVHGVAALLTGDIEAKQEQALLTLARPLNADLVLIPHHGSATSSTWAWLQAVQPQVAIAQTGYRNRFGHPHPRVWQRYHEVGAQAVSTPTCGAASWVSWKPDSVQCERAIRRKYWQHLEWASITAR